MRLTMVEVAPLTPIYNILCDGTDIGVITSFPGEGPMGTIRYNGSTETVARATVAEVLVVLDERVQRSDYYANEEEIYDEDGSIAFGLMLERRSEAWAAQDEFPW